MKILKPACFLIAATLSYSASAGDFNFVTTDDTRATKLCLSAAENDTKKIRKLAASIRRNTQNDNVKLRVVARSQNCNDMNIVHFASKYGAEDSVKLLARHLTPSVAVKEELAQNLKKAKQLSGSKTVVVHGS